PLLGFLGIDVVSGGYERRQWSCARHYASSIERYAEIQRLTGEFPRCSCYDAGPIQNCTPAGGAMIGVCPTGVKATRMIDLPDFTPVKVTQATRPYTESQLAALDHVALVLPKEPPGALFARLPQGKQLHKLVERARAQGLNRTFTRLSNTRATGVTAALLDASTPFARLTWARELVADCLRERPAKLGVLTAGLDEEARASAVAAIVAAVQAAAFKLPTFKTEEQPRPIELEQVGVLDAKPKLPLDRLRAEALGNNLARWLTVLPPNRLTVSAYREMVEELARRYSLTYKFLGEKELEKLGAGAFLAVARGNPHRDAGMIRLGYRPPG